MRATTIIRDARRRAGISQAQLALRMGRKQPVIARWESGAVDPGTSTTAAAVRACGFHIHYVLAPTDPEQDRNLTSQLELTPAQRLSGFENVIALAEQLGSARRL